LLWPKKGVPIGLKKASTIDSYRVSKEAALFLFLMCRGESPGRNLRNWGGFEMREAKGVD